MLLKIKYDTGGHFLHLQVVVFVFLTKLSSIFFLCTNCNLKKTKTYRCFANLMHFRNFLKQVFSKSFRRSGGELTQANESGTNCL